MRVLCAGCFCEEKSWATLCGFFFGGILLSVKHSSSCLIEILTSRTRLPSGGSPLSPARTYVKCPQGSFLRLCIFVMQENRMSIHSIMRETHCRYRQIDCGGTMKFNPYRRHDIKALRYHMASGFHTCGTSAPILCAGRSSFEGIVGRVIF